jgi:hypothetical protein
MLALNNPMTNMSNSSEKQQQNTKLNKGTTIRLIGNGRQLEKISCQN